MKTLAIIGSGDLGQQIAHYAISDGHYEKVVFFDDFSSEKFSAGYEIIGTSDEVESSFEKRLFDELLIGIGYNHLEARKDIFERFSKTIPFGTVIHSTVWKDPTAIVAKGCVIYPGCLIDANSKIEANTILNVHCTIAHDTIIGKHCFLSPRVAVAGFVTIDEKCTIGINATVIDNIEMVSGTRIGAAGNVIKNIEKAGLYVGNPCKFVK